MKINVSRTQVFRIVCPRCKAKQWEYCEDSQGFYNFESGILSAFHCVRIKKAERLNDINQVGFPKEYIKLRK